VDESGSVVQVEGTRGHDTLSAENSHSEFFAKPTVNAGWEEVGWCVNINHWHGKPPRQCWIYTNRLKTSQLSADEWLDLASEEATPKKSR
jgi:hypothetical protein